MKYDLQKQQRFLLRPSLRQKDTKIIDQYIKRKKTLLWPLIVIFLTFLFFALPGLYCFKKTVLSNRRIDYKIADFLNQRNNSTLNNYFLKQQEKLRATESKHIVIFFAVLIFLFMLLTLVALIFLMKK